MKFMDNSSGENQLLYMLNHQAGFDVRNLINSVDKNKSGFIRFVNLDCSGNEIYRHPDVIDMKGEDLFNFFCLLDVFKVFTTIRYDFVELSINDFLRCFCSDMMVLFVKNYADDFFNFYNNFRRRLIKLELESLPHAVQVHYSSVDSRVVSVSTKFIVPKFKEQSEVLGFILIVEKILLQILNLNDVYLIEVRGKDKCVSKLTLGEKIVYFKSCSLLSEYFLSVLEGLQSIRNDIAHNLNIEKGFNSKESLEKLMALTLCLESHYGINPLGRMRFVTSIKFFIEDLMSCFNISSVVVELGEYIPTECRSLF